MASAVRGLHYLPAVAANETGADASHLERGRGQAEYATAKPDAGSTISVKLLLLSVAAGTKDLAEAEGRTHPPDTAVVLAVVVFALIDSGGQQRRLAGALNA